MTHPATERNPFMLMINPEVVLAAMEKSERLGQLKRQLCRPLDRPTSGTAASAEAGEDEGIGMIVVGMPSSLDGLPTPQTATVVAFIAQLTLRTRLPIATEDERLTSREAESRLAVREKDWRKRKARVDAVAASIFLQDFLDRPR